LRFSENGRDTESDAELERLESLSKAAILNARREAYLLSLRAKTQSAAPARTESQWEEWEEAENLSTDQMQDLLEQAEAVEQEMAMQNGSRTGGGVQANNLPPDLAGNHYHSDNPKTPINLSTSFSREIGELSNSSGDVAASIAQDTVVRQDVNRLMECAKAMQEAEKRQRTICRSYKLELQLVSFCACYVSDSLTDSVLNLFPFLHPSYYFCSNPFS